MNDFSKWYLALLRKQVEEEIQFLVTNNHSTDKNYVPCMFCIERPQGYYVCHRLNELRQFLSSIVSHSSSKLRTQHERKRIGFEAEHYPVQEEGKFAVGMNAANLPLLSTKL